MASLRHDLAALTDDGLAQLATAGLVKRALREMAAGLGPTLTDTAEGGIMAQFADGTVTRLAPGKTLENSSCTCPSSGLCRHRLLLALSCRSAMPSAATPPAAAPPAAPSAEWSPASLDPAALEAALPAAAQAEMARLLQAGLRVRLDHGTPPAAGLPMATVRFLVPGNAAYARCDCALGGNCVHVALAVRAFAAAQGAPEVTLTGSDGAAATAAPDLRDSSDALLGQWLTHGSVGGLAALEGPLLAVQQAARRAGAVQMQLVAAALHDQITAHAARSARHDETEVLALATELFARPRALDGVTALGLGQPFETAMAKTRLISLGARLQTHGDEVCARVLLADSDTQAVLLAEQRLALPRTGRAAFLATLPQRPYAAKIPFGGLGRGQLLTSAASRRADGLLTIRGQGRGGQSQILPRDASTRFRPPLLMADGAALRAQIKAQPPGFLRPRSPVQDVQVFAVAEVLGQSWQAGAQIWRAAVTLPDGTVLHLERAHDSAAPQALDLLAAAMAGQNGQVTTVAGPVRCQGDDLICDPWSITADRFLVPDLDSGPDSLAAAPAGLAGQDQNQEAAGVLATALHLGLRPGDTARAAEAQRVARSCAAQGYHELARRLMAWQAAPQDPARFGAAAIWLLGLIETG